MSRVVRFDQFLPVEKRKYMTALEAAGVEPSHFDVSKMEISPPLMPGNITALVTVKFAAEAISFSYEDGVGNSWVAAFESDLAAGRFDGRDSGADAGGDPDPLENGEA